MPKRLADGPVFDGTRKRWRVEHFDGTVDWYASELDAQLANQEAVAAAQLQHRLARWLKECASSMKRAAMRYRNDGFVEGVGGVLDCELLYGATLMRGLRELTRGTGTGMGDVPSEVGQEGGATSINQASDTPPPQKVCPRCFNSS